MRLSLGLATYRALSWRAAQPAQDPAVPRPDGPLVWAHATSPERFSALDDLCQRLRSQRPDIQLVMTVNASVPLTGPGRAQGSESCLVTPPIPMLSDHPVTVRAFLDHWRPDLCLWTGGDLLPNLISMAAEDGTDMLMADLGTADLPRRRGGWLADLTRPCLDMFDSVLTNSTAAAAQLRRMGVPGRRISAQSRLSTGASPPTCPESVLQAATETLVTRPLWLAALLTAEEAAPVFAAHREALRFQHRLLLVAVPADFDDADALVAEAEAQGLRHADWHSGDAIGEDTQLLICDDSADLGLWYRMAPVTFVGSSLLPGTEGQNPYAATALGSAVLYGPHVTGHAAAYRRLTEAGAARAVRDSASLANAVVQLSAPDHAAAMALAGWETVTEGAALTDHLIELIQDRLDLREEKHDART